MTPRFQRIAENKKKLRAWAPKQDKITLPQVEQLLGVSNHTAKEYLRELVKEGLLECQGPQNQARHWRPKRKRRA